MKTSRRNAGLLSAGLLWVSGVTLAQEVRRAVPLYEPPVPRALPVDEATPPPEEKPSTPEQPTDKRQLEYANALFARKMYDLAIPEYEKYLSDYGSGSGRANAYFGLGESYRLLGKNSSARTNFQKLLDDFGDSEFAGPAAYALAVLAFSQKDFTAAQPLFHKAAANSKDASVALSAKYFEARCLESSKRADDALMLYLQVAEAKSQYREDARTTAGAMLLVRGRRTDALKQYEALASEAEKPATKAESAVRAGYFRLQKIGRAITGGSETGSDASCRQRATTTWPHPGSRRNLSRDHRKISQPGRSEGRALSTPDQHLQFRPKRGHRRSR